MSLDCPDMLVSLHGAKEGVALPTIADAETHDALNLDKALLGLLEAPALQR